MSLKRLTSIRITLYVGRLMDLPTHIIDPTAPHTHTVVFLHGRGDNACNLAEAVGDWRDSRGQNLFDVFPSFRWVFPQAPTRACASRPLDVFPQWFDTWSAADYSAREELQIPGLQEVVPQVHALLASEAARLETRVDAGNSENGGDNGDNGWHRLVLAGISMGGATSMHALINLDVPTPQRRLGALLTFSARCPFAHRDLDGIRAALVLPGAPTDDAVLRNTPMLLEHCIDDPLVSIRIGHAVRDALVRFGGNVTWKAYPDGGHWFNEPNGLDDVEAFLRQHVFDNAEARAGAGARAEVGRNEALA